MEWGRLVAAVAWPGVVGRFYPYRMDSQATEQIVKRGTFLYDGSVTCAVAIVQTSLRPGSGDADDPPEFRDDAHGMFYEVRYTPPRAERYLSAVTGFESVESAVSHVEATARGVSWES